MKRIILAFVTIAIVSVMATSCSIWRPIHKRAAHNNNPYNVSFLFEHEGCKVYRFTDDSKSVYFTNCSGNTSTPKSDSTDVQIQVFTNVRELFPL